MADALRAAFTLKLHDEISTGLRKIIEMTKQLRDLAKSLGFGKLDSAEETLRRMGRDIGEINSGLGATARQAEAAASAIKRMSRSEIERARAANKAAGAIIMPPPGALTVVGGGARGGGGSGGGSGSGLGGGSGGGRALVPFDAPFEPRAPIPLNLRPSLRGRLGDALGGAREGMGKLSEQVGFVGGAMAGISLEAPIHQAAELDQALRQIAIIQHMSGRGANDEINRLRKSLTEDAIATGQPVQRLAEAYKFLLTTGMSASTVDKLMPIHSRTATAYKVDPDAMGQAVFALHENLGISHEEMGGALAAMSQATQEAHFDMTSMSRYLPAITGRMNALGMTGRGSADKVFAALGTVIKNAADPAQAAIDFKDMMHYMTSPFGRRAFAKAGVDLPRVFAAAEKAGQDPMEAFINVLDRMTRTIKSPTAKAFALGVVLHNQQAGDAAQSLLQHKDEYIRMRDELHGIGADKLAKDFATAMEGLMPEITVRASKVTAIEQQIGLGFAWTVPVSSALLGGVVVGLNWMRDNVPSVNTAVFGLTAGMLGLVAAMGVLGVVAGPVRAGFGLLKPLFTGLLGPIGAVLRLVRTNPLVGVSLLMIAAATDIWQHWDRFQKNFHLMWQGLRQAAGAFVEFISASFDGDLARAAKALGNIWAGVRTAWAAMWGKGGAMETLMSDFVDWLPDWGKRSLDAIGKIMDGWYKFFDDMKAGMANLKLPAPVMAPPNLDDPSKFQKYKPGSTETPLRVTPGSYDQPSQPSGAAPRIHVTFEADVPGRARVRGDDGTVWHPAMRGPTLSRA